MTVDDADRMSLHIYAASGVELRTAHLRRAKQRLQGMGFEVTMDESLKHRHQRFAGTDEQRQATLHRIADVAPSVALASRGGYGMTRLLDAIDWKRIARSVDRGTRWVGYSDMTAFQLALLAHTGRTTWHGPMAADDFGRELGLDEDADDANAVTCDCFGEAMRGELEAIGFKTDKGFDGLDVTGTLWGGNLTVLCSLLGTPHFPKVKGGILFLEDVAEHPYRVERMLLQLHQAGVLGAQKAVLLGAFTEWKASPLDRGYGLRATVECIRSVVKVPLINGLPVGHVPLKMTFKVGTPMQLCIDARTAYLFDPEG